MWHDHDKIGTTWLSHNTPKNSFLDVLAGMPSARKLSIPHHWQHLNIAWERLSTTLSLPLAFICPRALCKYTLLDLDLGIKGTWIAMRVHWYFVQRQKSYASHNTTNHCYWHLFHEQSMIWGKENRRQIWFSVQWMRIVTVGDDIPVFVIDY